ncbi:tail fiber assembly protein [Pseudomonas protegens]|uniref:Tail fiber assembly protein n=1 Tax=Pseudomonas idahonensis TaxID=2942628 RepID=A0ABT5PZ43_9PSED|nr:MULTISPECIES: tail fiber assembly protein [Pseudomonas]MDD1147148.1 tail fiber assembly protein [Pseudomonas idahonensis]MDP9501871.1 tail fiber assembly protein [Pseudomonas protegens]
MAWFFDKKTCGFLTTQVYGERMIEIPDPEFVQSIDSSDSEQQAPLITVPNPRCSLPPEDQLVPLTDNEYAALFAGQAAGQQIARGASGRPELVDPAAPSTEDLIAAANSKRDALLLAAALRIAPLQDVADFDEATAAELTSLNAWKQYRVAVNRVSEQQGYPGTIDWPRQPGEPQ